MRFDGSVRFLPAHPQLPPPQQQSEWIQLPMGPSQKQTTTNTQLAQLESGPKRSHAACAGHDKQTVRSSGGTMQCMVVKRTTASCGEVPKNGYTKRAAIDAYNPYTGSSPAKLAYARP